jgi:hypothetical protein
VPSLSSRSRNFGEREWTAALQGALVAAEFAHSEVRWCNRPSLDGILRNKIALLASARAASLPVPELRIGNYTPTPAGDQFVVKAINADEFICADQKFTTADFPAEMVQRYRDERVPVPTLVQTKVNATHEIRSYVVGSSVLSYQLEVPAGVIDSRLVPPAELHPARVTLDHVISRRLVDWTQRQNLAYCAFDLLVDCDGVHMLIDINPHGTWGWYSEALPEIEQDISDAFLKLLTST